MKNIKLNEKFFYTENFDYDLLKKRRKTFETHRVSWFLNTSPKQEYKFPVESIADFNSSETWNYYKKSPNDDELIQLFNERTSTLLNSFTGNWHKDELFRLLSIAIGPSYRVRNYKGNQFELRNYPSGGALYSIKLYLITNGVQDMNDGAFYISPMLKKVIRIDTSYEYNFENLFPMTKYKLDPLSDSVEKVNFGIFMIIDFEESFKKYGELSERLAMIEAGHIGQNLQLITQYLKKKSLPICGLFPEEIEKILEIADDEKKYCVYGILFG